MQFQMALMRLPLKRSWQPQIVWSPVVSGGSFQLRFSALEEEMKMEALAGTEQEETQAKPKAKAWKCLEELKPWENMENHGKPQQFDSPLSKIVQALPNLLTCQRPLKGLNSPSRCETLLSEPHELNGLIRQFRSSTIVAQWISMVDRIWTKLERFVWSFLGERRQRSLL